mmetsp:Transcript_29024/g.42380  ORF Transcript_29024/g.42380 Transcript_29024/m.42380 type:complete len:301 (-) Transcript_29024:380-1282(-)
MHLKLIPTLTTRTKQYLKSSAKTQHGYFTVQTAFVALDAIHYSHEFTRAHACLPERVLFHVCVSEQVIGCHGDGEVVEKGMGQHGSERVGGLGVYDLCVAVLEEASVGLGHCGEHEHVAEVEVADRTGRFSVGGETAVELLLGIGPWRVVLQRFSRFNLVLNALDDVRGYHGMQARHGLVEVSLPRVSVVVVVVVVIEADAGVYEAPHVRAIVPRELLRELRNVVIIIAGHVPPGPAVHLKVVLVVILHANLIGNVLLVDGVDLAALRVALEQLLGHVLAACQHVHRVQPEEVLRSQLFQ